MRIVHESSIHIQLYLLLFLVRLEFFPRVVDEFRGGQAHCFVADARCLLGLVVIAWETNRQP